MSFSQSKVLAVVNGFAHGLIWDHATFLGQKDVIASHSCWATPGVWEGFGRKLVVMACGGLDHIPQSNDLAPWTNPEGEYLDIYLLS